MSDVGRVVEATALRPRDEAFRCLADLVVARFGRCTVTVNRTLLATEEVERVFSDDPGHYPVGGRKQKRGTDWAGIVLHRGELFVASGPATIARHFDDHALIASLGITEIVNVPVLRAGRSVATLNLSRFAPRFTEAERQDLLLVAGLVLPLVQDPAP